MHQGGGKFTNPLLECLGPKDFSSQSQLHIGQVELNNFVNNTINKNKIEHMSVYIRDLNNGPWIGINETEEFIGGSLLKVPVLISYMKLSESDQDILEEKIEFKEKKVENTQYFAPSQQIELGKTYTVHDLLQHTITYSDNEAINLLANKLNRDEIYNTFGALGMGRPDIDKPYPVNVKTYAGFFRILFNASYLSRTSSEQALELLSKVEFDKGITANLPKNIIVAHKFGERSEGDLNQLHDCGIVYYPNHPYLLCIMSKGGQFDDLAKAISSVSKFVYDQISENQ
jgi:beta-lactamase class A